jgi:hypothetical protein
MFITVYARAQHQVYLNSNFCLSKCGKFDSQSKVIMLLLLLLLLMMMMMMMRMMRMMRMMMIVGPA